jgi:signal transduction histidine kinase
MNTRRTLSLPIALAIVMITILVILTVGWVLLSVFGALAAERSAVWYWVLLTAGTVFIGVLLAGVILYLILSVKVIGWNRQQASFIDAMTHELKSPIASMKLVLQTLGRHQVSEEERARFYRYMLEDVERLDHLINQILDAGRLESGRERGDVEEVQLATLLRQSAEAVCASYRLPKDIIALDVEPCTVWARSAELTLIFRNLLDNAVKYAGTEPEVAIHGRKETDGKVVVQVSDNGCGIPPNLRRKIFGRFVRLRMELEREKPGAGLGLHIVRTLVQRLRGRIRVYDRQPGPGTVFEVELPCGNRPAANGAT